MRSRQVRFSCWGDALIEGRIDHLPNLVELAEFLWMPENILSPTSLRGISRIIWPAVKGLVVSSVGDSIVLRSTDGGYSRRRSMPAKDLHSSASLDRPDKLPAGKISRRERDSTPIRVLSVSRDASDHLTLQRILSGLPWAVSAAANCSQAVRELSREKISVIFCESLLEDGTWKSLLAHIRGLAHPPLLVVTSRVADEHLWAEVLNLGGYDVLAKPFSTEEVRHVCTTASLWLMQLAAPPRTAAAG